MRDVKNLADKIVNAVLLPFGRCRVRLGEWPADNVAGLVSAIEERGGVPDGEGGMIGFDEWYFRLREGRVKISIIEYGASYLWGPKRLVRELAGRHAP